MNNLRQFTAIIEKEGEQFFALCPELDIASQGETVEKARYNLLEALQLFFESASDKEILERVNNEVFITRLDITVG
jgi:predicted RNase H-like HicB family nuclease